MQLKDYFNSPAYVFGIIIGVSVFSLTAALFAQFALDMQPCIMCIYQRIPFVIAALLGIAGLALPPARLAALGLSGLAFLVNSGLAFYHTGIEQRWWSETAGCNVNFNFADQAKSLLNQVMSAQASSCADIPWQDPLLGLSMANYNVLLCAGMFVFCVVALRYHLQNGHDGENDTAVE